MFSPYLVKQNISQFVHISSKVHFKSHESYKETNSKCSVFAFGFETCIKTILPLISRLINEALLLLTTYQSHAAAAHWRPWLVSDKHVPACQFQSVSPSVGARVWFSCSQGWKWMVHITVMSCCSNSCCQTSVKLLATFAIQYITHVQEHWAAVTQDSGLHTRRGLPTDQTSVL